MPTPIGPTSPVNLPAIRRTDGMGDHSLDYWLNHPADALDEIDKIECEESLLSYMKRFWHVLEPSRPLSIKWPLEAITEHLQAVTDKHIKRLLITVPPGWAKSITTDSFWPSWEWGPRGLPSTRYIAFSYSSLLTLRDNGRFRDLILNHDYARLFGDKFNLQKVGEELISNDQTGWKFASSVGGVSTGARADRLLVDDAHNIRDGESDTVRLSTTTWFREALQNRVNDRDSAIVVIMQRVHEEDVAGVILSEMADEYEHLSIPYEWEGRKTISTVPNMVWNEDPRTEIGQEAWPERLPMSWKSFKTILGPYAVSSQYQQTPSPRGGGIIRRDWWQLWDPPPDSEGKTRFPQCEFVVASFDGAFGQKQENDWSALTIWGVFKHAPGVLASSTRQTRPYLEQIMKSEKGQMAGPPVAADRYTTPANMMLMHAWRKRLPLNGLELSQEQDETDAQFKARQMKEWGIVQWIMHSCKRYGVNMLLIEAKANGIDVGNEVRRQMSGMRFGVELIDPGRLDKVSRAYAVQHIWADGMVWYPDREWADEVISEAAVFPKGGHDDYVDTCTMSAKWLRDRGMLLHTHELERDFAEQLRYNSTKPQSLPLYPI